MTASPGFGKGTASTSPRVQRRQIGLAGDFLHDADLPGDGPHRARGAFDRDAARIADHAA
ncbi:hypothetical protein ASE70_14085 [Sphingomonas sp. Leaf22]|nr:hypothetical protein ASE70_14085 [Sphingomonas sp. Leaf22]